MSKDGFTLLELLVVIIIVGILATLGLVNYRGIREHALGREAFANLQLIAAAERIYRMEQGFYYPDPTAGAPTLDDINDNLKLSLTATNWTYAVGTTAENNFTAFAERVGNTGWLDCVYGINQGQNEPAPTSAAGTCP